MFETKRTYTILQHYLPEILASQLTNYTWCGCNGFGYREYLFLNDAISEDGAQEYAIYRILEDGRHKKIESVTFSWASTQWAEEWIKRLSPELDTFPNLEPTTIKIEDLKTHLCHLCA